MATSAADDPTSAGGLTRVGSTQRSRWWLQVVAVFVAARAITTVFLLILASVQGPNPWTAAHPNYFEFATIWDGRWYNIVAVFGYPSQLPLTNAGQVAENAWAFMPGYPFLVSGLMRLTGIPWAPLAVFVSLAFGMASALVFYRLMRLVLEHRTALFAVVLLCVAPVSPLMQLAYAESMHLFFVIVGLYLLVRRRYWLMLPVIFVFALTRPSGLAFALAMLLHLGHRWWQRRTEPFAAGEVVAATSVTIFSGLMGLAWPAIAWAVTGQPNAYLDTELAWRSAYVGYQQLMPFTAWFQSGGWWLGQPLGTLVVAALIVAFALIMFTPAVKRLGFDLRAWTASYFVYLLAVFFPQSSTFRLLLPMFPLLGVLAQPKALGFRIAIVVVSLAAQLGWLLLGWGVDGADWTPP